MKLLRIVKSDVSAKFPLHPKSKFLKILESEILETSAILASSNPKSNMSKSGTLEEEQEHQGQPASIA